jgi:hypothetical protein
MLMTPSVLNPLVYFLFYFIFCFGPLVKFMQNPRRAQVVQNQSVTGREGDFCGETTAFTLCRVRGYA